MEWNEIYLEMLEWKSTKCRSPILFINSTFLLFENGKKSWELIEKKGVGGPREQSSPSIPQRSSSAAWIDWSCCSCGGLIDGWLVDSLSGGLWPLQRHGAPRKGSKHQLNQPIRERALLVSFLLERPSSFWKKEKKRKEKTTNKRGTKGG